MMILYIVIVCLPLCHSLSLEIDNQNGSNSPDCLTEDGPPCLTLEFITQNCSVRANLFITILSPELVLHKLVSVFNISNFTLQGLGSDSTTILCHSNCSGTSSTNGAGLRFIHSSSLKLMGFSVKNCSARSVVKKDFHGLILSESSHIVISNVKVSNSFGYGLSLTNSNGNVSIENCTFESNQYKADCNYTGGSSGLLIHVSSSDRSYLAHYKIRFCKMLRNTANLENQTWESIFNHGGGMLIVFLDGINGNVVEMSNCVFSENKAVFGGGLYILCEPCNNSDITVIDSTFEKNYAIIRGGGIDLGYSRVQQKPANNNIQFINCLIFNNNVDGQYGGGVAITVFTLETINENVIAYKSCRFEANRASGISAVSIFYKAKPSNGSFSAAQIIFEDSYFLKNFVGEDQLSTSSTTTERGTFIASGVFVFFQGKNIFESNQGTALFISDTKAVFKNAKIIFRHNIADRGGAILLVGEAYIKSLGNNTFSFERNIASFGGALCALSLGTRYFQYTDNCFLQKARNINASDTFEFFDNHATTDIAHDIFVSNLLPCKTAYNCSSLISLFSEHSDCEGNLVFLSSNETRNLSYATAASRINIIVQMAGIFMVPGIPKTLDIAQIDQFGKEVGELFPLSASVEGSTSVEIDENYVIITDNTTLFRGTPGDTATLVLQSNSVTILKAYASVHISDCPPGFSHNKSTLTCECSEDSHIISCGTVHAKLLESYWAGYISSKPQSESFATGACIYNFCNFNHAIPTFRHYYLPLDPNSLNEFVCGTSRSGVLCSLCASGYDIQYHSPTYKCNLESANLCSYGFLFYILSEIVPTTMFFLIIIFFNIHLTSGSLYSFIFYAQSLDIFFVDMSGSIKYKGFARSLLQIYKIFYGSLNLKFFFMEDLSFCIKKGLNLMDLFLIQYLTLLYALFLILVTLLILKVNSLYSCIKLCYRFGRRNIRRSVINGLTAFIVLCYFRCVELTCNILASVQLFVNGRENKTVALFNGELEYLKGDHLKYAIPAFVCIFVIIFPPPFLLLSESTLLMLSRHMRIKRNCCLTYYLHRIRLKGLPFLESFQGCFRDNCQCFAGLFLVYRVLMLMPNVHSSSISTRLISAEVVLFIVLAIHLFSRPFQKCWQNNLDLLLLSNLLLVNMLTLCHYYTRNVTFYNNSFVKGIFELLQISLISLPLIFFLIYIFINPMINRLKFMSPLKNILVVKINKFRSDSKGFSVASDEFPPRMIEEEVKMKSYDSFSKTRK